MKFKIISLFTLMLVMVLTGSVAFAQTTVTLTNPSFEQPGGSGVISDWSQIPGWDCGGSCNQWITDEDDPSSDGVWNAWSYSGGAYVSQTTSHTYLSGVTYTLKYDLTGWDSSSENMNVQVRAGTTTVAELTVAGPTWPSWSEKTIEFTADAYAGQTLVIRFMQTSGSVCAGIDNFRLTYTGGGADTDPPTPDPSTWATVPAATSASSISMTATTASDPSGGIEYYFDCTAGGGTDSGWQSSSSYEDIGLSADTQYTYRVNTRDSLDNTGSYSTSESATTLSAGSPLLEAGNYTHNVSSSLNPALVGSGAGWDSDFLESGDAFEDGGTYYWYYHAYGSTFQIGLATASDPTGTWTRDSGNPVLALGSGGAWDDGWVACAAIYKEGSTYYLFYSGGDSGWTDFGHGVATSSSPSGPWTKYSGNPIVTGSQIGIDGYMGGVVKVGSTYYMYVTDAFDTQCDYGPIYVLTSTSVYGPWTFHSTPVLSPGTSGAWDDGGFSEAEVLYYNNLFHIFYGGAEFLPGNDPVSCTGRANVVESIGYAYSSDGFNFTKSAANPVVPRSNIDNVNALAEVHTIIEEPYVYFVSTVRWTEDWGGRTGCPDCEDIVLQEIELTGAPDTDPPTPDPMTFATAPYSTGTSSIAMVATNASDASGVEYYFDCTSGGGNDSGWQDSTSYEDTGLSASTEYCYRVNARDKSANQNATAYSGAQCATTDDPPSDTDPPTPDPSTWSQVPTATGSTSITMTATTATDPSGGVQYYFEETTSNPGADDSGWQSSSSYTDTGLSAETQYTYKVNTRDGLGNTGSYSTSESATTDAVPSLTFENGMESGVVSSWTTVNLENSYNSMVVVATANYDVSSDPAVVRIRNASGSSFDVRVDSAGGTISSGIDVYYMVVEEGVYTQAADGVTMEAVKFTSTVTDENNSWVGESRSYSNTYTSPVVLGQVMTYNDSGFSTFWCAGSARANPPDASNLIVGKSVAEDTDTTRNDETIGYIVIESGSGTINVTNYVASLGADSVEGVTNSPPYSYSISGLSDASIAVVSQSAMDGGNGGWALLYGSSPVSASALNLAVDEDVIGDTERSHTAEQVAYIVFEGEGPPPDTDPPTPDPMSFATAPYSTGTSSIAMVAATASDASGVEYYFDCTSGGGNDSGWQDSTSYEDTGLSASTQYCYRVNARDKSANQNATAYSGAQCATTDDPPSDTDPPTPNPSTWSEVPTATGSTSITMTATTATDPSGGVQYYFDETSGNAGADDSGWQSSSSYTDIGLSAETQYTYQVRTRDGLGNTGSYSTTESATTPGEGWVQIISDGFESDWGNWNDGGTDALRYTGGTFAAAGSCAIDLQDNTDTSVMTTNNLDLSGYSEVKVEFEYYPNSFDNSAEDFWLQISTDGGSSFDTVEEWNVGDEFENGDFYWDLIYIFSYTLTSNTQLRFRCDASGDADDVYIDEVTVSAYSGAADTDPPTPNPSTWDTQPYATGSSTIAMTADIASDPHDVEYYFDETTGNSGGSDSDWQFEETYTDAGLSPDTQYTYQVRTRDLLGNTGSYSTSRSATTEESGDVYPASDPGNTGNWTLRGDVSDEFDGTSLDENKWFKQGTNGEYRLSWPGRAPGQFAPENISVSGGNLRMVTKWDPDYDFTTENDPDSDYDYGDPPITGSALIGNNMFTYGYMEIRCKAADAAITSSFWAIIEVGGELDVFEFVGKSKNYPYFDYLFESSVHCAQDYSDSYMLDWRVADDFHIYGCEWDADNLKFYADGELIFEMGSSYCLDDPEPIWLSQETFYWHGFPTESELPVYFLIDYIRVWQN